MSEAATSGAADHSAAQTSTEGQTEDSEIHSESEGQSEEQKIWEQFDAAEDGRGSVDPGKAQSEAGKKEEEDSNSSQGDTGDGEDKSNNSTSEAGDKPAEENGPDIWASAPPELKAAYEAAAQKARDAEHRYSSDIGRLSAFQKKIDTLEGRLKKYEQGDQSGSKESGQPDGKTDSEAKAAAEDYFESAEWKAFKEEFPELAAKQQVALKPLLDRIGESEKTLSGMSGERQEVYLKEQYDFVLNEHSDYETIKGSDGFREWYARQEGFIQDAVKRNADRIVNGREVSRIVDLFKKDTGKSSASSQGAETQGAGQTNGQSQSATGNGGGSSTQARSALSETRQTQLESSSSPRTQGRGAVSTGIPKDPESAWKYFEDKGL